MLSHLWFANYEQSPIIVKESILVFNMSFVKHIKRLFEGWVVGKTKISQVLRLLWCFV